MLLYGRHCLVVSRLFYVSRSFACLFCFCFCFHFVLVLVSAVEYTTKLQRERQTMQEEADLLRKQIQELNASIRCVFISLWWSIKPVFCKRSKHKRKLNIYNFIVKTAPTQAQDERKVLILLLPSRPFSRWKKSCCLCICACACTHSCVANENQDFLYNHLMHGKVALL